MNPNLIECNGQNHLTQNNIENNSKEEADEQEFADL